MDYKYFYEECWEWFSEMTGVEKEDIPTEIRQGMDAIIASSEDACGRTVEAMERYYDKEIESIDDDIENNNWLGGLWNVVRPKEKDYDTNC
jgi:hypothetical protein